MAKKREKFPAKIFIYEVDDHDARYLGACYHLEEVPDDQEHVAVYALTRVGQMTIKRDLV